MRKLAVGLVIVLLTGAVWSGEKEPVAGIDPFFTLPFAAPSSTGKPPFPAPIQRANFRLEIDGEDGRLSLFDLPGTRGSDRTAIVEWPDIGVTVEALLTPAAGGADAEYRVEWRERRVAHRFTALVGESARPREFDLHATVRTRVSGTARVGRDPTEIAAFPIRVGGEDATARLSLNVTRGRPEEGTPSAPVERVTCRLLRIPKGGTAFEPDAAEAWLRTSGVGVLRSFRLARDRGSQTRFSTVVEREYRQDYNCPDEDGALMPPIIPTIRAGFSGLVSPQGGLAYDWTALRMPTFTTDLGSGVNKVTIDLPEVSVVRGEAPLTDRPTLHPVTDLEGGGKLALLVGRE